MEPGMDIKADQNSKALEYSPAKLAKTRILVCAPPRSNSQTPHMNACDHQPIKLFEWINMIENAAEATLKEVDPTIRKDYISSDTWDKIKETKNKKKETLKRKSSH